MKWMKIESPNTAREGKGRGGQNWTSLTLVPVASKSPLQEPHPLANELNMFTRCVSLAIYSSARRETHHDYFTLLLSFITWIRNNHLEMSCMYVCYFRSCSVVSTAICLKLTCWNSIASILNTWLCLCIEKGLWSVLKITIKLHLYYMQNWECYNVVANLKYPRCTHKTNRPQNVMLLHRVYLVRESTISKYDIGLL